MDFHPDGEAPWSPMRQLGAITVPRSSPKLTHGAQSANKLSGHGTSRPSRSFLRHDCVASMGSDRSRWSRLHKRTAGPRRAASTLVSMPGKCRQHLVEDSRRAKRVQVRNFARAAKFEPVPFLRTLPSRDHRERSYAVYKSPARYFNPVSQATVTTVASGPSSRAS